MSKRMERQESNVHATNGEPHLTVVGLGEALFDCFPDRLVLGGAPLNIACHANQLLAGHRGEGIVASRIGDDPLGRDLRNEMSLRGLRDGYLQADPMHPTGQVRIALSPSGEPSYEIVDGAAWDHLEFDTPFASLAKSCSAICFGTLAQRHELSRSTIQRFVLNATQAVRLFDANLRQDFYSAEVLESSLRLATMAKLNAEELREVCELLEITAQLDSLEECAYAVREVFALDAVAVTRGSHGTQLHLSSETVEGEVPCYDRAAGADSVGAGDACCAGIIVGMLCEMSPGAIIRLANHAGAFVASQPGATPQLPAEILEMVDVSGMHSPATSTVAPRPI